MLSAAWDYYSMIKLLPIGKPDRLARAAKEGSAAERVALQGVVGVLTMEQVRWTGPL